MAARDYYEVLEVPRNASEDQIRSAYRRLARQFHPDVNQAADAGDRFKEITEAYEVLADGQRRQRYDMFGSGGGQGDFGIGDLFETFFGGENRRRENGPLRGADLRFEIEIDLIDAVRGGERTISIPRLDPCARCKGDGAEPGTLVSACTTCKGAGEVRAVRQSVFGRFVNVSTCTKCGGSGRKIEKPCTQCRGEGRARSDRPITLNVPQGIDDGQQLRVSGEGEAGMRGGPTGDLYVLIRVKEHARFKRDGDDLLHVLRVTPAQAALGADLVVPTIEEDEAKLKVPPGAQHGQVVRLRGKGVPHLGQSGRGDQLVFLDVVVPKVLTKEERRLYERLREISKTPDGVDDESFFERVKDAFGG